ncbi:MAG TPA: U32 family peptidase [Desulfobacteraceae bacterium]|nr:U32 family peptidase [Desulfobacteraceae bacterium]
MKKTPFTPELLAPAGNFEKLEIAVQYGADAVYLAGKEFSLRNFSGNFTMEELSRAVEYAHRSNVKVYLACNIYSRTHEQQAISTFLHDIGEIGPDALIAADPGIIHMARAILPRMDIHLSTQASTTSLSAVQFWEKLGIKRVNLARELSLDEIQAISSRTDVEIETFIHGAMCISYSGRCLLSSFLSGRDSNRGACSHPCRWKYSVVEEQRPGDFHPIMEDSRGTYLFNARDLCMIDHLPGLFQAGITSFKIEGRMKGLNYLASVVRTYRRAIDACSLDPENFSVAPQWRHDLAQVYHRSFSTGFYFNSPRETLPDYDNKRSGKIHNFIGRIVNQPDTDQMTIAVKNRVSVNDRIEIVPPGGRVETRRVIAVFNKKQEPVPHAQPNTESTLKVDNHGRFAGIVRLGPLIQNQPI